MDVIREARVIFDNYQIATEILAARSGIRATWWTRR